MDYSPRILITLGILLVIGAILAGCSDSPAASPETPVTTAAPTAAGHLYAAGDIVRSASGTESTGWLVIDYDPAADSYTRALVNKGSDGTWYRTGATTEKSGRAVMEKVYTVKITQVAVASVGTQAPATVATQATTSATRTATTTTATATATTSSARPGIKSLDPEEGEAGATVRVEMMGNDFLANTTALLRNADKTTIKATTVSWISSSRIAVTFDLPNTTKVGTWDVVVTNPNGLSGELTNWFIVHGNGTTEN
jgi:hypothetical protein